MNQPRKDLAFHLPWPPSVNGYWRAMVLKGKGGKPGRVANILSAQGREYKKTAAGALLQQGLPCLRISGRVAVKITAFPPDRRARDLDNILKPLLDALQASEVILDDSQVDDLRVLRGTITKPGSVFIELFQLPSDELTEQAEIELPVF